MRECEFASVPGLFALATVHTVGEGEQGKVRGPMFPTGHKILQSTFWGITLIERL